MTSSRSLFRGRPVGRSAALVFAVIALGTASRAEFSGRDPLDKDSTEWTRHFTPENGNKLVFVRDRLEFQGWYSDKRRRSVLRWTRNRDRLDRDWFVQVRAEIPSRLVKNDSNSAIGIGVVASGTESRGYMMAINRGRNSDGGSSDGLVHNGFKFCTLKETSTYWSLNSATKCWLRIHYNHRDGTFTGSWRTRDRWRYFEPVDGAGWLSDASDHVSAVLIGSKFGEADLDISFAPFAPSQKSAYLRDFRCGAATPVLSVEQPLNHNRRNGKGTLKFGSAPVGSRGGRRVFHVYNDGTADLRRLRITRGGRNARDFRIVPLATRSLKPGESAGFKVVFRPRGTGTRRAILSIRGNTRPFRIKVAGNGSER